EAAAGQALRACEKIAHLLRTPLNACGGGPQRPNPGHLVHQTPRICPPRTLPHTPSDALATVAEFFTSSESGALARRRAARCAFAHILVGCRRAPMMRTRLAVTAVVDLAATRAFVALAHVHLRSFTMTG